MIKSYFATILMVLIGHVLTFNLDETYPLAKQGPNGSLFGLSVAQHKSSTAGDMWMLVGAPNLNITYNGTIYEDAGALYKCPITETVDDCERVEINERLGTMSTPSKLGITVQSQDGGERNVVVCAHLWNKVVMILSKEKLKTISGRCFTMDHQLSPISVTEITDEKIANVQKNRKVEEKKFCQLGTSASFGSGGSLYVGGPGCYDHVGTVLSFTIGASTTPSNFKTFKPYKSMVYRSEKEKIHERHAPAIGYSVAASKLDADYGLAVTGSPRAQETGCVVILNVMERVRVICAEQVASSFGAAVALVDLDGDGKADLLVGAPGYFNRKLGHGGVVYVYKQHDREITMTSNTPTFAKYPLILYGGESSAFGSSIVGIGDVNGDGMNDVAIGAPNDDGGIGSVHIYHGQEGDLVDSTPSQVIKGEKLQTHLPPSINALNGFGYSLSGGMDMDGNTLPDLVIGTRSDSVIRLRSRPIISIHADMKTSHNLVSLKPNGRDLSYNFTDPASGMSYHVTVFQVELCLSYSSIPATFNKKLNISYVIELDTNNLEHGSSTRASFTPGYRQRSLNSSAVVDSKSDEFCEEKVVYLLPDVVDKLSPIDINITINAIHVVSDDDDQKLRKKRDVDEIPDVDEMPVKDMNIDNNYSLTVNIAKNCGPDNICDSALDFDAFLVEKLEGKRDWEKLKESNSSSSNASRLVLGIPKEIGVHVNIWNEKEDAHQAMISVYHSKHVRFTQAITADGHKRNIFSCSEEMNANNETFVKCDIGNPFSTGSNASMILKFSPLESLADDKIFNISVQATTTSEQVGNDVVKSYLADIYLLSEVTVDGFVDNRYKSIEFSGNVVGQSAVRRPEDAGLYVIHEYEIANSGLTDIRDLAAVVSWPNRLENEKWLLYFIDVELVNSRTYRETNNFACTSSPVEETNPLGLRYYSRRLQRRSEEEKVSSSHVRRSTGGVGKPYESYLSSISCPSHAGCLNITCRLDEVPKQSKWLLRIRAVTWNSTFLEEYGDFYESIEVGSSITLVSNHSEVMFTERSRFSAKAKNSVVNKTKVKLLAERINFWLVLAAAATGIVLLVMIILVCWRCGFFVRKQHEATKTQYHKAQTHLTATDQYNDAKLR